MASILSKTIGQRVPSVLSAARAISRRSFYVFSGPDETQSEAHQYTLTKSFPLASESKRKELKEFEEERTRLIKEKYPTLILHKNVNIVAYRATSFPPEKLQEQGGFLPKYEEISIYALDDPKYKGSFNAPSANKGFVNFSLVPEIAGYYLQQKLGRGRPAYIYAMPIENCFVAPGRLKQPLVPVLPLPSRWISREGIELNGDVCVRLSSEITGCHEENFPELPSARAGEAFNRFISCENLRVPYWERHSPGADLSGAELDSLGRNMLGAYGRNTRVSTCGMRCC